tara:strand:+ start:239 stop:526 length:288 start_codon:yes stop_codon:yes gene_type:complete
MAKYISIVTASGVEHIPCESGLYVERNSATRMDIYLAGAVSHHLRCVTVASTFALVQAIQDALVISAETSNLKSVTPVAIPSGQTVTSITMTAFA